jgi:TatD DNase family protein
MQFIDVGVNLMDPSFNPDREDVLKNAEAAGVSPLIITGNSMETSAAAAGFAEKYPGKLFTTAGVHPHNARFWKADSRGGPTELRSLCRRPAVKALGECGLDYNRNFSPQPDQRQCFEDQLSLAADMSLPVFLHERDAFKDFSAILRKHRPKLPGVVVHCFTGAEEELEAYLALDVYIGITGWVCDERRGSHLIALLKRIPADRLLLETDAPYLLPRNLPSGQGISAGKNRRSRNEPRFLPHIAGFIARALDKDLVKLAEETTENARRFFNLS